MSRQEQEGEREQWETEAGWLCADPHYVQWLNSFEPWFLALNNDKQWIKEHS